ncbi:MAG: hypothetical protein GF317_03625 [Candidatus Lokiarchaeota archaeon]|nr:hypothetical protein [Candidatus Lokiarchaeota archaeon]MBD3198977.1 hypothetical protein [Candidatus Lokiarchaeota archaeon]
MEKGNMISEITYTETLTFWSTLISAPSILLGSYTTKGMEAILAEGSKVTVKSVLRAVLQQTIGSAIQEVFQEIVEDGLIETLAENGADILGLTDDVGFLLSSLGTSGRELKGSLAQLTFGSTDPRAEISNAAGDTDKMKALLDKKMKQQAQMQQQQSAQRSVLHTITSSTVLKSAFALIPAILTMNLGLFAAGVLKGALNLPKLHTDVKAAAHARRKQLLIRNIEQQTEGDKSLSAQSLFIGNLQKAQKKPSELSAADLNALFRRDQETNTIDPPITIQFPNINSNTKLDMREKLSDVFTQVKESTQDLSSPQEASSPILSDSTSILENDYKKKYSPWHLETAFDVQLSDIAIGDPYEGLFAPMDMNQITALYSQLFDSQEHISQTPQETLERLHYPVEEIQHVVEALIGRSYDGMDIIESQDGKRLEVRQEVLERINQKRIDGVFLSQIEQLILGVGAYLMSNLPLTFERDMAENLNFPSQLRGNSMKNENEKGKHNLDRIRLARIHGVSMLGKLDPNGLIAYEDKDPDYEYDKNDIIVFNRGPILIVHEIVKIIYNEDGTVSYRTKGINNRDIDRFTVAQEDVKGLVVEYTKEEIAMLEEMALNGRIPLKQIYAQTEYRDLITKLISVIEVFDDKSIPELSRLLMEFDNDIDINGLSLERFRRFKDDISKLLSSDSGITHTSKIRTKLGKALGSCYKALEIYMKSEINLVINDNVKNIPKTLDLIIEAQIKYNFNDYEHFKGILIENVKVDHNNIAHTTFNKKNYPTGVIKINERFFLDSKNRIDLNRLEMVLNDFIPHELEHIKIRQRYDKICKNLGIDCLVWNIIDNAIAEEIEEFLVDANALLFLDGDKKIRYAQQYCKWIELLLSEEWSHFTDESGTFKDAEDLTSRQMLIIMHHKVILEYIENSILSNNRDVNAIKQRINDYYLEIRHHLESIHKTKRDNIEGLINNFILNKFESYFNLIEKEGYSMKTLNKYLRKCPDRDWIWIEYVSTAFVPGFILIDLI